MRYIYAAQNCCGEIAARRFLRTWLSLCQRNKIAQNLENVKREYGL